MLDLCYLVSTQKESFQFYQLLGATLERWVFDFVSLEAEINKFFA